MSIYPKETKKSVYQNVLSFLGFNYNDPSLDFAIKNDVINNVPFGTMGFEVTQTGITAPVLTLAGASYAVNADGASTTCRANTCRCQSVTTHTFCSAACCTQATYVSPGVYIITLGIVPPNGFDVLLGEGVEAFHQFGISKIDNKSFYLKSYLAVPGPGAYSDNILNGLYLEIKLWNPGGSAVNVSTVM